MSWIRIVMAAGGMAAVTAIFFAGSGYQRWRCEAEKARSVAIEIEARRQAEHEIELLEEQLEHAIRRIEIEEAEANARIEEVLADNRRLVAERGMRDPGKNHRHADLPRNTEPARDCDEAEGGAKLSDEAAEFLLALAADGDRAAVQLSACQRWAAEVMKLNSNEVVYEYRD